MKKVCLAICCALSSACAFIPDFYSDVSRDRNAYKSMQTYALEPFQEVTDLGSKYVYEKSYELNRRNFSAVNEPVMRVLTYTVEERAQSGVFGKRSPRQNGQRRIRPARQNVFRARHRHH